MPSCPSSTSQDSECLPTSDMSKKVCCVRDCPARHEENLTYFSLPVDPERLLQWLKVIGRPDLYQNRVLPKNYVVCSAHFDRSQMNIQQQVLPDAVPTRHVPRTRKGELIFSSNTASQTDFPSSEDDDDDDDYNTAGDKRETDFDGKVIVHKRLKPNRRMYFYVVINSDDRGISYDQPIVDLPSSLISETNNLPRDSISLGNRKIFVFDEDDNAESDKYAPASSNAGMPKQVEKDIVISEVTSLKENEVFKKFDDWRRRTMDRRKGAKYERDFKIFALNLHSINTRAYRMLMKSWQLPSEKELKEMQLNIGPRFDERMTKLLSQKFGTLSNKAKYCTLGMHIMPLKPHLFYDPANDEVIGVHNVNGLKRIEAANFALVAMVRGLKVPWCQPVAFSLFSTMTDCDNIDVFLTNVIVKLRNMGLKILSVVMDDNPHFWRYCRSKHFISVMKPYLNIAKEKVLVVFDLPHVLNLFRDELTKNDFLFDNKIVSWNYLKQVYAVEKERGGGLLPKLSDELRNVANKDKNIENTCEVLSERVSRAMYFYINHGLLPKEAAPTAELLKKIGDVFDVLNADKTGKGIINTDTQTKLVGAQNRALDSGASVFRKVARVLKDKKIEKSQEADSLKYFLISFKSLLCINATLKEARQIGILQTSMCYLDPMIELCKSIKKDSKNKPSSIEFTRKFSKLFLHYLIDLTPPPTSIGNMADFLKMADGVKDCHQSYDGKRIYLKDKEYRFCLPEVYAIIYVSSFLLYKCSEKHMCKAFEDFLNRQVDLKRTKVYVNFEKYNKEAVFYDILKLPPIELPAYVERLDDCFLKRFADLYHTNPAETILCALSNVAPWDPPCPCFPFNYMLKLFVRTRIYQTVLHNTRRFKNKSVDTYTLEVKKL